MHSLIGHTKVVASVDFNELGTQVVSGGFDNLVKVWDVESGKCLQTIEQHSGSIVDTLFSPNSQQLISASQDLTIRIWEKTQSQDWQCQTILRGHENNIWSIALNSTGKLLVSSDQLGMMKFWDVSSGQCIKTLSATPSALRCLSFHPTANLLVSGGDDYQLHLWDFTTQQCLKSTIAHSMAIWQVVFAPQGNLLASGGLDGTVKLWQVTEDNDLQEYLQPIHTNAGLITGVRFHPQAKIVAACGVTDAGLWNYETGELLLTIEQSTLGDLAFHPHEEILAIASHDPTISLWDIETGKCCQILVGHESENWTVSFHPQGELLASGGEDNVIRLWHWSSGECHAILSGHTGAISCVAFSPDGVYLASASKDCTIRIWEVATGQCLRTLTNHTDLVNHVVFHPDPGRLLMASCGDDKTIRIWDTDFWICVQVLRPQRIYERLNITGVTGLTAAQLATLKELGAVERVI